MKYIKRISLIFVAVLVLACSVPLSSLAVDPVSAATMANAFAQAITAYGASQGVSMTFDVANTDGIGEGVHELWNQYQADMANSSVTVSDYQNLAASAFPTLWIKIGEKIGVNLDAALVGEIDGFWNWLLSGPAEMTKVDNQYFEWTVNSNTGNVDPITVYNTSTYSLDGYSVQYVTDTYYFATSNNAFTLTVPNPSYVYMNHYGSDSNRIVALSMTSGQYTLYYQSNNWTAYSTNYQINNGWYECTIGSFGNTSASYSNLPVSNVLIEPSANPTISMVDPFLVGVQPYVGDAVPQDVYIPDNNDVNYEPIPAAIPTDITWDNTRYGDGTGTLTDAQSEAITQDVDQEIVYNPAKTLELADPAIPPVPSPSEVYIPFLPVTLPSFQFSLSGIWHYVTAWVASLGAWFSIVFTTWSYLPYAISVPVYATAVIVIVLGVYKRFFM